MRNIDWELVNEWNEMEPEEREEWANFQKKLIWMIPMAVISLFVEGGIILTGLVFMYSCYGFSMKAEYKEYVRNLKKIAWMES